MDIGLARSFPQTVIGKNEAIVTASALRPIEVNPEKGDSVELYVNTQNYIY